MDKYELKEEFKEINDINSKPTNAEQSCNLALVAKILNTQNQNGESYFCSCFFIIRDFYLNFIIFLYVLYKTKR